MRRAHKRIGTFRNNDDNIMILFILCASAVAAIGIFPPFLRIGLLIIGFCVVGIIVIFLYEALNYIEEL